MPSIKRNFFYNSLLTVSNYVFPMIIFPYVSRVLGVANIGICNFVDSVVQWFILISMMGMAILGNREMAAIGADREKRDKAFSELVVLNLIATLIAAAALVITLYTVPKLFQYRRLLWVGVFKLFANFLCIEWFFKGTENFSYITSRTIIVKFLYLIAVFVFVRKADDYPLYYLLTVLVVAANALINVFFSRKSVTLRLKNLDLRKYLKPFLILGIYMLLTSMYVTFNTTYLGFVSSSEQVGCYAVASKLYGFVMAFFSAFTSVMLPRISSLVSERRVDEFHDMVHKSYYGVVTLAIPLVIYACVTAPEIVRILAGVGYEGAVLPARIIMPLILIVALEQIFVIQILMPSNRDRAIFINSCAGALVGITLNILLVSRLQSVGSAIAWLVSEITVLLFAAWFTRREEGISFSVGLLLKTLLGYMPALGVCLAIYAFVPSQVWRFVIVTLFMLAYSVFYIFFVQKDKMLLDLIKHPLRGWKS